MPTQRFNVIALANTLAIIDILLHPLFHIWTSFAPRSYEWTMNLFVAGPHLHVDAFDESFPHIVLGTILEAATFWILGAAAALLYNLLAKS